MKANLYEEMNHVLSDLCEERTDLQSQIDTNNLHIQETQTFNKKIQENEEDDFRIFSPRKNMDLHRSELEQSNMEKEDYEKQNSQLEKRVEKLDTIINIMQEVLKDTEKKVNEPTVDLNLYNNLESVLHKIQLSIKFISQDPDRAKLELSMIVEALQKILQQNTEE